MKKVSLLLVMTATLLFNNSYSQVTSKSGTSSDKTSTMDKADKKDKVQSEMSGDAASTAKDWTQKLDEVCVLDATQEKKIMEINLRYANRLEDLKTKYKGMDNPSADAAKAEKDELTKQRLKEYSNVLTKEQMQKFKEYRKSKKDESGAGSTGSQTEKKDEMKEKYNNATPEEQAKMKEEMKAKKDKKDKE